MPRNMSFSKTINQVRDRSKTVTRRCGWWFLKPGDRLWAVEKAMGLKKGEKVERITLIEVLSVRREALCDISGQDRDVVAEGFPAMTPGEFVIMFCDLNQCSAGISVNRIEFKYVDCVFCGERFSDEAIEVGPYTDYEGDPICDECHQEHYEFKCCLCENYEHTDHQHAVLAVIESVGEVQPGLYRITDQDYCTHSMIGEGWLHPNALDRVGDVPDGTDCGYPCGHLCRECAAQIPQEVSS